jgi:hypothetical protein
VVAEKLNPADHFTLMMDHEIRASGLAGNFCGLVLELDGVPESGLIAQRCREFARRFPRAVARLKRHGRQYVWNGDGTRELPFHHHKPAAAGANAGSREQLLLDILNRPTAALDAPPAEVHLVEEAGKSLLLLRWFHPACDAKGAELVLHHLFQPDSSAAPAEAAGLETLLNKWRFREKARLAWQAIFTIRRLDRQASILPESVTPAAPRPGLRLVRLDREQSARIMAQAVRHTGMAGVSLYFIGCLMRALEQTGSSPAGDAYCIPYAMNFRKAKALYPLFGNQVSFLFAQAGRRHVQSRETLFAHLREQHKQAIRSRQDHAMLPLMQLGSWLTLEKHGRIVRRSPHGRDRSSAWFSYTGDMYPEPAQLAGCNVSGLYQLSPVTLPPALGLLASRFDGRIVLSYNFIEGCFPSDWLDTLIRTVTRELLAQDPPA